MKRIILSLFFIASPLFAEGPLFRHKESDKQQEFENVYKDFRSKITKNNVTESLTFSTVAINGTLTAKGTVTNDNAATGYIGEYISSVTAAAHNNPATTGNWGDLISISLTAGDWNVFGSVTFIHNSATYTGEEAGGISVTPGNSTPPVGNRGGMFAPTSTVFPTVSLSGVRFSVATSTTVYLKSSAVFSAGTPQMTGSLKARRMR